jgi:glutamate-1-semialdehyde 2,1-aminomutase
MESPLRVVCIVQARINSRRLPAKVMKPLGALSTIGLLLQRLDRSESIGKIVVAIPEKSSDTMLEKHIEELGFSVFRGHEEDVLKRVFDAAVEHDAEVIVRVTGDCPLIDVQIVDSVIDDYAKGGVDYTSNIDPPTFPDGMDVEVFSMAALKSAHRKAYKKSDREHVTTYFRNSGLYSCRNVKHSRDFSHIRLTIDEQADYEVINAIVEHFSPNIHFSISQIIEFLSGDGRYISSSNQHISRNEGYNLNSGQKLWRRAKKVIPTGNSLLSKRPELFLPDKWPTYYSRTEGCKVWDLDGNCYIDFALMGVGTNLLGYSHLEVDDAVRGVINSGNMSSLNAPDEVYLAERLIDMHGFAEMARFCRTGGEANAVAVRIARAVTGRETVAICGYHGWHDWYLAANLGDESRLDGHLLPGLSPRGVPSSLQGSVKTFDYNRLDQLEKIVSDYDVAAIKMEVVRNMEPADGFLQKVRALADKYKIVLIFDECTTGFRETFGGIHKKYLVEPDIAVYGKALGNGYAVTALIGTRAVMDAANSTFISSTFWTERVGSVAALKVLDVMERQQSWKLVTEIGKKVTNGWQKIADSHGVLIERSGIPALCSFNFQGPNAKKYKTLISQEMLTQGFLASNAFYACTAHNDLVIDRYFDALDEVFIKIGRCERGDNVDELLTSPLCEVGFKRLN